METPNEPPFIENQTISGDSINHLQQQQSFTSNPHQPYREEFYSTSIEPLDDQQQSDGPSDHHVSRERKSSQTSLLDRGRPSSQPMESQSSHDQQSHQVEWQGGENMSRDWSREGDGGAGGSYSTKRSSFFGLPDIRSEEGDGGRGGEDYTQYRNELQEESFTTSPTNARPSSFYGLEGPNQQQHQHSSNYYPPPSVSNFNGTGTPYSESIVSTNFSREPRAPRYQNAPYAASRAASLYAISTHNSPSDPSTTAVPVPLLDHSHLQPGILASLLSHEKTLDLYRANVKKTNDPDVQFEFCTFVMEVVSEMKTAEELEGEIQVTPSNVGANQSPAKLKQAELVGESVALLNKLANRGHVKSQYFLADCYTQGVGTAKGKRDYDKAFPLFVLAGKHGHVDACFRAAQCCENGWGCKKDFSKAVTFLRRAAALTHPGAMHRLGMAELNGELGLTKRPREGVKWLKRSAEIADQVDPPQPQSLHELAILHEKGIDNVVFKDEEYAAELLARAAELQYSPSAFKLGECYEYGKMGCPQDSALSIHYYNIAAQQDHRESCFALTAWYLVGSPGVLPQSDTEAYLWAKKAADMGLAKAEYAVGYFTEVGIGTPKDNRDSLEWFRKAAEHGDKRAKDRLRLAGSTQHFNQYNNQAPAQPLTTQPSPSKQQQQPPQDPYSQFYENFPASNEVPAANHKRYLPPQNVRRENISTGPVSRTQRRMAKEAPVVQTRPHSVDRHTVENLEFQPQQLTGGSEYYTNPTGYPNRPPPQPRQRSYSQPDPVDPSTYNSYRRYPLQEEVQEHPSYEQQFSPSSSSRPPLPNPPQRFTNSTPIPQRQQFPSLPQENQFSRLSMSEEDNPRQPSQQRQPIRASFDGRGDNGNGRNGLEGLGGEKRVLQRGKKAPSNLAAAEEKDCVIM